MFCVSRFTCLNDDTFSAQYNQGFLIHFATYWFESLQVKAVWRLSVWIIWRNFQKYSWPDKCNSSYLWWHFKDEPMDLTSVICMVLPLLPCFRRYHSQRSVHHSAAPLNFEPQLINLHSTLEHRPNCGIQTASSTIRAHLLKNSGRCFSSGVFYAYPADMKA